MTIGAIRYIKTIIKAVLVSDIDDLELMEECAADLEKSGNDSIERTAAVYVHEIIKRGIKLHEN